MSGPGALSADQAQLLARLRWLAGQAATVGHSGRLVQRLGQIAELAQRVEADPALAGLVADGRREEAAKLRSLGLNAGTAGD